MKVLIGFLLIALFTEDVVGQSFSRAGRREYSLQPQLFGSRSYTFADGAAARIDGGVGIGLGFAQHLNDYLAFGVDFAMGTLDYRATITPGAGNTGAAFDSSGVMERASLRLHGTWHLFSGRTTPFLTAGVGATHLDPDLESAPPSAGCWNYPWWGQFCGAQPPTHGMTRLSAAAGAGLRHELAGERGFVRLLAGAEWIDWPGPPNTLRNVEFRADFGARF